MEDQKNPKNPFAQPQEQPQEKPQTFVNPFLAFAQEKKESVSVYLPKREQPGIDPTVSNRGSAMGVNSSNQFPTMNDSFNTSSIPTTPIANENKSPIESKKQSDNDKESSQLSERSVTQKFENLGFHKWEIIQGEMLVTSIKCKVLLPQYPSVVADGMFVLTTYRLMFKPIDDNFFKRYALKTDYLKIPLGFLLKIDRNYDKKSLDIAYLDIHSKDGRILRLRIVEKSQKESASILQYLQIYGFPDKKEYFFAFEYNKVNRELEDKYEGWKIYDIEKEFKRQGATFSSITNNETETSTENLFRIIDNRYFKISATYPPLFLVPAKVTDQALIASSKFRTRERLPVVTYFYKRKGTILSRSSQSKPGLYQNRCLEDEQMLRYLGNPYYNESKDIGNIEIDLSIFDARPYLNAMAQKVNGKGFEDTKWYRNCEINFMDIDNIHHVREAHRKILSLCSSSDLSNNKWYSQLEATNWLELLSFILSASSKVAQSLQRGLNCLVHCSDGWDRTAQILSLAQIMLDPYFRTIEGFEVLIMKEWVSFGHQFYLRMAHGNRNDKDDQRSPIFLQFLDCVHQLINQYPFAFEFNDAFLIDLAYHSYSCQFGTFLCNNYQELILYQLDTRTISIWSYLNSQRNKYLNHYYDAISDHNSLVLRPNNHLKYLRLWEEYFLYYSWLSKPNYNLSDKITFPKDFGEFMYAKEKKVAASLRSEVEKLRKILQQNNIKEEDYFEEREDEKILNGETTEGEKIEEDEKPTEEIEVVNLEGDKDQALAKEQKEEGDVIFREKEGHLEFVEKNPHGEKLPPLDSEPNDSVPAEDESQRLVENEGDSEKKEGDFV